MDPISPGFSSIPPLGSDPEGIPVAKNLFMASQTMSGLFEKLKDAPETFIHSQSVQYLYGHFQLFKIFFSDAHYTLNSYLQTEVGNLEGNFEKLWDHFVQGKPPTPTDTLSQVCDALYQDATDLTDKLVDFSMLAPSQFKAAVHQALTSASSALTTLDMRNQNSVDQFIGMINMFQSIEAFKGPMSPDGRFLQPYVPLQTIGNEMKKMEAAIASGNFSQAEQCKTSIQSGIETMLSDYP